MLCGLSIKSAENKEIQKFLKHIPSPSLWKFNLLISKKIFTKYWMKLFFTISEILFNKTQLKISAFIRTYACIYLLAPTIILECIIKCPSLQAYFAQHLRPMRMSHQTNYENSNRKRQSKNSRRTDNCICLPLKMRNVYMCFQQMVHNTAT